MTSLRDPATTPVVVACCRTAIGRSHPDRGLFRHVRGDELATAVVQGVVERSGVDPATIEDVILGATQQQGELGGDVARCAALMAGLPLATAGATVNRLCGSSLEAIARAAHAVAAGAENVQVAGGVEHMHHLPMESAVDIHPRVLARTSRGMLSMGLTAEHLAATHGISRRRQEEFALESHAKAARAADAGLFDDEIVRVLGLPPAVMGTGPIAATRKLLARVAGAGITLADIDLVEVSEAFAAQAIHCIDELGLDPARVNVRGGTLAIGHPLGASGARLATTLLHTLRDSGGRYGLATMCIGLGQGIAILFERVQSP